MEAALGCRVPDEADLRRIEAEAERMVLEGGVLVCGVHSAAHRKAAAVPLRWGGPRVVVLPGGFPFHLGRDLSDEPFAEARLWRHVWDPGTDLAVSRRAPDMRPRYGTHNPGVDRLIRGIAAGAADSDRSYSDPFGLGRLRCP